MKELLVGFLVAFLLTTGVVYGAELTEVQKAELALQAAKMKEQRYGPQTNVAQDVRKEAEAWSELGTNVGHALIAAAKEVGVAANEFAETPLGKVVIVAVVYKMFGHDLIGYVVGFPLLFIGVPLMVWCAWRGTIMEETFEPKEMLWGLFNRKMRTSVKYLREDLTARTVISGMLAIVFFIASMIVIF